MSAIVAANLPLFDQAGTHRPRAAEPNDSRSTPREALTSTCAACAGAAESTRGASPTCAAWSRGLCFAAVDGAQSGHPGGSSSKAEQVVTLLASARSASTPGSRRPAGRDRVVWSAGHCSAVDALVALVYETLRRNGDTLTGDRRRAGGLSRGSRPLPQMGRTERARRADYALADTRPDRRARHVGGAWLRRAA